MFKYGTTNVDSIKLKLFSSSLSEEAKVWYNKLSPSVITTWEEMRQAFVTRFFPPAMFDRLVGEIQGFTQNPHESLVEAWLCMKDLLCNGYGHGLGRGTIIQIFHHGLDDATQAILDVRGIFLYETPNEAYQLLKDQEDPKKKLTISTEDIEETITVGILEISKTVNQEKTTLPSELGDPGSFLIPCTLANSVECLALADLGTSINLMPYSLYASLFVNTLKPTRMSIRLANHTYQYPIGVAENMLVHVGKFLFPVDFIILEIEEDNKVPLILGRCFLHTVDAIIRVKSKELNLRVEDNRITFLIDKAMQHSHSNDDTCFRIDVIDEVTEEELDALLNDSEPFLKISKQEEKVNDNFEELPLDEQLRIKTSVQEPPTDLEMKP
ncbi:reverse transcriptase domain-containing protein [Tanacetum coccineum]|uniref:Reverse transcriptase domain-containing protein n=1 Tax=Tanacetum coccineum TaxID=301880 RepID=A0ABQ5CGV5_9ASTR